jgi:small-conductance mechanosensitive channel/CRP-like cAMP-binding protein
MPPHFTEGAMHPAIETILYVYLFLLGIRLLVRRRGDLRQAGFVLAFLVMPSFALPRFAPQHVLGSRLQLLGTEIELVFAVQAIASIFLGANIISAVLSWIRRLRFGDDVLAFHRFFVKLGIVLVATPIVMKVHDPSFDFGKVLTSAAVGSVIFGLALQKPLGNLFSGMSNEVDNVLRQGEFVQIGGTGGPRGFVVAKTWRGIQLETLDSETVFVPNDQVFTSNVVNYDRPKDLVRRRMYVKVNYRHPPAVVKETLYGVFAAESGVLRDPPVLVRTKDFVDDGVVVEMCYWISGMREDENIADRLRTAIWYAFKERTIEFAHPLRTIMPVDPEARARVESAELEHVESIARTIALTEPFATHSSSFDRHYLARNAALAQYGPGESIVRRGDPSDAMYVMKSGSVDVLLPDGRRLELRSPGFFGDIGILHQTARTADVVAGVAGLEAIRIGRFAIEGLLARSPALRRELFQISDDRLESLFARERVMPPARPPDKKSLHDILRIVGDVLRPF